MENPAKEIEGIIHCLTQGPPDIQRATIEKYFTTDASFTHPFCRTGSFEGSRVLIRAIYRWYKIMSPQIQLSVDSIAYDATNLILYVSLHQVFSIWLIPFHKSPVSLTTVLKLRRKKYETKYYIESQNDLYQVNEFVRFFWFGGYIVVWLWQIFATFQCFLLAWLLSPLGYFEQSEVNAVSGHGLSQDSIASKLIEDAKATGSYVAAPAYEER